MLVTGSTAVKHRDHDIGCDPNVGCVSVKAMCSSSASSGSTRHVRMGVERSDESSRSCEKEDWWKPVCRKRLVQE